MGPISISTVLSGCGSHVKFRKWLQLSSSHEALNHVPKRAKQKQIHAKSQNFRTAALNAHRLLATQIGSRGNQGSTDHSHRTGESHKVGRTPSPAVFSKALDLSRTGDVRVSCELSFIQCHLDYPGHSSKQNLESHITNPIGSSHDNKAGNQGSARQSDLRAKELGLNSSS